MSVQVVFFESKKSFVNCQDAMTGNTALHIAARHGHMVNFIIKLTVSTKVYIYPVDTYCKNWHASKLS